MKKNFSQQWLEVLCLITPETHSAMFLMPSGDNDKSTQIQLFAKWPADLEQHNDFTPVVKYALKQKSYVCIQNIPNKNKKDFDFHALPVYIKTKLLGVIVLKSFHGISEARDGIAKSLQHGAQWLTLVYDKQDHEDNFYNNIVGLLASSFEQDNYQQVLNKLVSELTLKFKCDRVAFGEYRDNHCHVLAISNSAEFNENSNLVQRYENVMDEAVEQDTNMIFPDPDSPLILQAHQDLFDALTTASLCTIPLIHRQKIFGAISLTRKINAPFDDKTINICQQTFSLLTPFLSLKQEEEKSLLQKTGVAIKKSIVDFLGFKYVKVKLVAISLLTIFLLSSFIKTEFNITSDAALEGKVQRNIAAPIAGFLISSSVKAGDKVAKGDKMATLENTELTLKISKLEGKMQQVRREYRDALASQDMVKVRVVSSQSNQIAAEKELAVERLKQTHLYAPFDGVVIEGDLSKKIGVPLERGVTLFKIAPLAGYRVILKVDERSISYIKQGQTGELTLTSMPNMKLPLTIRSITAIANAEDGDNIFRVEASLDKATTSLRPGMEGIGKINAGRATLLWIWTHDMVDRVKLWYWAW